MPDHVHLEMANKQVDQMQLKLWRVRTCAWSDIVARVLMKSHLSSQNPL